MSNRALRMRDGVVGDVVEVAHFSQSTFKDSIYHGHAFVAVGDPETIVHIPKGARLLFEERYGVANSDADDWDMIGKDPGLATADGECYVIRDGDKFAYHLHVGRAKIISLP